jgi:hypothetical protein
MSAAFVEWSIGISVKQLGRWVEIRIAQTVSQFEPIFVALSDISLAPIAPLRTSATLEPAFGRSCPVAPSLANVFCCLLEAVCLGACRLFMDRGVFVFILGNHTHRCLAQGRKQRGMFDPL